jgi:glycerol-3-phosphate dehydrogenase subunit B
MSGHARHYDTIVIGSGLSGLLAAAALAERGARVYLVAKGGGYLHFTSGCVDVLGSDAEGDPVNDPLPALDALTTRDPSHPYALAGQAALKQGIELFCRIMSTSDYPFAGSLSRNMLMPTALGTTRTTSLVPTSMVAGEVCDDRSMLIVGFRNFRDFFPPYLAANLRRIVPYPVHDVYLDLPALEGRRHLLSLDIARCFDDPDFRDEVIKRVKANLHGAGRIGFPAVLGLDRPRETTAHLEETLGMPVFEIPTLPPSVAGIRVNNAFRRWLMQRGVRIEIGFWVEGRIEGSRAVEMLLHSAGRKTRYSADAWVLATGGTGGGGIKAYPDGRLQETVFDLPVEGPADRTAWYRGEFLGREPQPISLVGVRTNQRLQALGAAARPVDNVFVAGSTLPSSDPTREKSGEGVALATGWKAAMEAMALFSKVNNVGVGM